MKRISGNWRSGFFGKSWTMPVNGGPNMDGHEVYHPRRSNHVRYFTISLSTTEAATTISSTSEVLKPTTISEEIERLEASS